MLDPLYARAAVFSSEKQTIAFLQLDTLSVTWEMVCAICKQIQSRYGVSAQSVMICATHNHAGPAIASIGEVTADATYVATLTPQKVVSVFGQAFERQTEAEFGTGHE